MNAMSGARANAGERERLRIRTGAFTGPTSGLAPGNVQANLVILPKALAYDFLRFREKRSVLLNVFPCLLHVAIEAFEQLEVDADYISTWSERHIATVVRIGSALGQLQA